METLNFLKDYYVKYPEIFEIFQDNRWKSSSQKVSKIFKDSKNPNAKAIELFLWLKASKFTTTSQDHSQDFNLNKLSLEILENAPLEQISTLQEDEIEIDPNFIHPLQLSEFIPPFLSNHPPFHELGDRVINLDCKFSNCSPFGSTGTIIGIQDFGRTYDILFDHPFIGGKNSNGRLAKARCGTVKLDSVFNMNRWADMICKRDREKWERGWNGKIDHKKFDHQFRMKNNSTKSDKNSSWRPPPPEKRKFDMISKD